MAGSWSHSSEPGRRMLAERERLDWFGQIDRPIGLRIQPAGSAVRRVPQKARPTFGFEGVTYRRLYG
jgi:hypothetical protein